MQAYFTKLRDGRRTGNHAKTATYDLARMMDGATEVKCSEFGGAIIKHM